LLFRILGLILIIVGLSSIISIALPSFLGTGFKQTLGTGNPRIVGVSSNGVYLVYDTCTSSIPISDAYRTVIYVDKSIVTYGARRLVILNHESPRVHIYLHTLKTASCISNPPADYVRINSISDLDNLVRYTYSMPKDAFIYHGARLGEYIDITDYLAKYSLGFGASRLLRVIVAIYIPADSFEVEDPAMGTKVPGKQVVKMLQSLASSQQPWTTPASGAVYAVRHVDIWIKMGLIPRITWLMAARAASIIGGGFLIIVADASIHPEYYTGKWRIFRKIADKLRT
jgi:hypothetical protein